VKPLLQKFLHHLTYFEETGDLTAPYKLAVRRLQRLIFRTAPLFNPAAGGV
jgi:hypothetical protein